MNDLAEKALRGAAGACRQVRDRPMVSFGVAGFVLAALVVIFGAQVAALRPTRPLSTWLGLQTGRGASPGDQQPATLLLLALVLLVLLWIAFVATVRRQRQSARRVWAVAGAWALPFVVGPPLSDTSVYSYVAYGRLVRLGHDPYTDSPNDLGSSTIVSAIDPAARGVSSSAGPLGTLLAHLSVTISGGRLIGAVLVFRAIGVLAAFAIGRLGAGSGGTPRGAALAICLPNPLVLLYVISSPHLEGIMVALLFAAVAAARRRSWPAAVVLAAVAGSITTVGFVAVPLVLAAHWLDRRNVARGRLLGRDVLLTAVVVIVARIVTADGFGWLRTGRAQFDQHTPFAVADAIGRLISTFVRAASYDDLAAGGQITALVAAAAVLVYLVVTARLRTLEAGIGFALLAAALLAPVLHPWYLMWGVLVFAPTATGARRVWVFALTAAGCVLTPPGFTTTTSYALTGIGLGVIAVVTATVLLVLDRRDRAAGPVNTGEEVDA